jgi:uncharacterized protein (TIGR02266 family)
LRGEDRESWLADEAPTHRMERRTSERVTLDVEVTFTSDSQFFAGLSGDISEGGLFVQTYQRHPIGSRLSLTFSLPTGQIRATGIVRWIREATAGALPGVGIAFEDLPRSERAQIDSFCRSRPPLYHDLEV